MSHQTKSYCDDRWLRGLPAPIKNHFFYGMLLTEEVLCKDQRYFDGKRWLLNRLGLGAGILSGLDFHLEPPDPRDAKLKPWKILVDKGVALDGFGREIVVPEGKTADNSKPGGSFDIALIDDQGEVKSQEVKDFLNRLGLEAPKTVTGGGPEVAPDLSKSQAFLMLQIAYHPVPTDPLPVKAGHCAHSCESGSIRESFRLRVTKVPEELLRHLKGQDTSEEFTRADATWPVRGSLPLVFPQEPTEDVRHRWKADEDESTSLIEPAIPELDPDPRWVTLGIINVKATGSTSQPTVEFTKVCRYYHQLFSNDALSKLVFGLAERVDEAARVRVLTFEGSAGASGEGQTTNVYQPLANSLSVKVIDSAHSIDGNLSDFESIVVRFEVQSTDGGILSTKKFDSSQPYDARLGTNWLEVGVKRDGTLKEPVYWRLHKTPGLHTVSARIVPKVAADPSKTDPPFHPGSQITFHATAKPTAPTIVGIDFEDPWWYDDTCHKYLWNDSGNLFLRFKFSRHVGGFEEIIKSFRLWAVHRHRNRHHGLVSVPQQLHFDPHSFHEWPICPAATANPKDLAEVSWLVRCRVTGLPTHLSFGDTLRIVLLGKVDPKNPILVSVGDLTYPTKQGLDLTFEGSSLSADYRQRLWDGHPYFSPQSGDESAVSRHQPPAHHPHHGHHMPDHIPEADRHLIDRFWDRFEPLGHSLPTGDGTEGGEFHKTFEFRLPCGC